MNVSLIKSLRLDKFLYFTRIAKSRSIAAKLISKGHVLCDGTIVKKRNKNVYVGNELEIDFIRKIKIVKILKIPEKRKNYQIAKLSYEDQTPSENKLNIRNKDLPFIQRVGRPTKLDRRRIDKLMGRD